MDLPKTFDEFVDARKQGFIRAKEFKDNGGKLAGCLCSYTPQELLDAAGVATVGLCGTSSETIPDAEKVLPKNLCPLIKSTYGFAYSEKCPYTYFSDIIIGETTCDGKKKMYELLNEIKETYVLHLPQSQERPYAKDIWYEEVKLLKEKLEEKFNCTITEEGLRKAAHVRNELRKAQLDMYHLQKLVPPAMKGTEMMIALQQGTFTFDVYQQIDNIRKRVTEAKKAYEEGKRVYPNKVNMDSLTRKQQRTVYDLYYNAGRNLIRSNPRMYGDIVIRPVDRRENYVKRCVGLPGDTLQIKKGQVYIDGKAIENPTEMQFNYFVQTTGPYITDDMFRELGISKEDQTLMTDGLGWEENLIEMGLDRRDAQGRLAPVYHLPLTKKMYETLSGNKKLISNIIIEPGEFSGQMYPLNLYTQWDRNNYGPIWIPAKGATIKLTEDNLPIYERCIVAYEGNKLEVKEDGIYINGEKTDSYTFNMDYYWMMGDNRDKSADSRYWGFVPEDHVVGKPIVVWLSLDKDRGWFDGKIRWNRIFKWVDGIK